jgi:hypothetical protein
VTIRLRYCPRCDAWRTVVVVWGEKKPKEWVPVKELCQICGNGLKDQANPLLVLVALGLVDS